MRYIPMREMGIMRSLRRVGLASTRDYGNLRLSQFEYFPPGLEILNMINSNIKVRASSEGSRGFHDHKKESDFTF